MRVLMRVTAMLVLVLAAQFFVPGGASAAPAGAPDNSTIASRWDGRCLDSDTRTPTHNGTNVQIWDCHGGNNQNWTYRSDHTIRSTHDNRCLDVDTATPTHNGTNVQVWGCNDRNNQKWTIGANGRIQSWHDNRCLDLHLGSPPTHNGTNVQVWACNGNLNQRWDS